MTTAGLFKGADKDKSGTLDRSEFATLLCQSKLGLSDKLINTMLAEADDNADGVISYGCALHPTCLIPTALNVLATHCLMQAPTSYAHHSIM